MTTRIVIRIGAKYTHVDLNDNEIPNTAEECLERFVKPLLHNLYKDGKEELEFKEITPPPS